jgi:DivIVA domain-containing protein
MGQLLLFIVVAVVVAAIVFGVTVMLSGGDSGLTPVEADGRAVPLPSDRPLGEDDIGETKFDVTWRGYRMAQVDQALQRAAYDIGYKGELIGVLEAEVIALREGRTADADVLRRAREAAVAPVPAATPPEGEGRVIEVSVTPAGEAQHSEAKSPEAKSPEAQPAEVKPAEVKPAEVKAAEVKPAEVKAGAAENPAGDPAADAAPTGDAVEESEAVERR